MAFPREPAEAAGVQTTRAIVLRLTRLTDTSLIVHWFTQDLGLVKTVAKGARRPASPFAGKLDLFFGGEMCWLPARSGELHILRDVAIHDWRERLRQHYSSTLLAAYFGQLLELAVEPEHPEPLLYDLLQRALDHVTDAGASLRALRHFESELARLLGVAHHQRQADESLSEALGPLPASRPTLIQQLATADGFGSPKP
ncbi:MAG: DNA repair protein RecO [Verrucomicrobia bacterium]|nr:MAG: DNA repair protein RecO [Verrucomicrobiota bacterium]